MNKIFICLTVYQLFNAINMRQNIFEKEDKVDIILIDRTDFSDISENLKDSKLFNEVYYIKFDDIYKSVLDKFCGSSKSKRETFLSLRLDIIFYDKMLKYLFKNYSIDYNYDSIYIANYSRLANMLYNMVLRRNPTVKLFFYEDGIAEYCKPLEECKYLKRTKYINFLNTVGVKLVTEKMLSGVYLYQPELSYTYSNFNIIKLPTIDKENKEYVNTVNAIFNYKNDGYFDRKFILFDQCFSVYNITGNDVELFKKVIDTVGEENVIIKLHPRTKEDRFEDYKNLKRYSGKTPWELIMLNENFNDKILITINSNAVVTPFNLYKDNCKSIVLQKLFKSNDMNFFSVEIFDYYNKIKQKYPERFFILEQEDGFVKLLDELIK